MRYPLVVHRSAFVLTWVLLAVLVALSVVGLVNGYTAVAVFGGLVVALAGITIYPQWYEIDNGTLRFRSGIWTFSKLALSEVVSIRRGRSWPASFTMYPLPGIRLMSARGSVFVIPADERAFLGALKSAAPHLGGALAEL